MYSPSLWLKASILLARFSMTMVWLNNEIVSSHNLTLKVNQNTVGFNQQMLYLKYVNIIL